MRNFASMLPLLLLLQGCNSGDPAPAGSGNAQPSPAAETSPTTALTAEVPPTEAGPEFQIWDNKGEIAFRGKVALAKPDEARIFIKTIADEDALGRTKARVRMADREPVEAKLSAGGRYLVVKINEPLPLPSKAIMDFTIDDFGETSATVEFTDVTPVQDDPAGGPQ